MFPWQVFGLCRFNPTRRTSQIKQIQCHLGLSYLLTAAGQLRNFTGFPFHSPQNGETSELKPLYIGTPWMHNTICCGYLAYSPRPY